MIKVVIVRDSESKVLSIRVTGHADSGPYGHDLVCAAVSAIITGGANALVRGRKKKELPFDIVLKSGDSSIEPKSGYKVTDEEFIILETIVIQLKTIEESSPQLIKIEEKTKN